MRASQVALVIKNLPANEGDIDAVSIVSLSICHEVIGLDAMILVDDPLR